MLPLIRYVLDARSCFKYEGVMLKHGECIACFRANKCSREREKVQTGSLVQYTHAQRMNLFF